MFPGQSFILTLNWSSLLQSISIITFPHFPLLEQVMLHTWQHFVLLGAGGSWEQ